MNQRKIRPHIIFLLGSLLFLLWFLTQLTREYQHTLVLVAILWPISIGAVYFINLILIKRFLFTHKYWLFASFLFVTLLIVIWISLIFTFVYFTSILTSRGDGNFPFEIDITFIIAGILLIIASGVLGHVIRENFRIVREKSAIEKDQLLTKARLKELELENLKAQLQPHFLFNTLNNIYSLSLKKAERAPEMILKLANLLDHTLYKGNKELIPIHEEIDFIQDYLDLIHERFGPELKLDLKTNYEDETVMIPPMLFLPLIENAVKHGIGPDVSKSWIEISITQKEGKMLFTQGNSVWEKVEKTAVDKKGLGLQQVKSQLDILYANKYTLDIEKDAQSFRVNLKILTND